MFESDYIPEQFSFRDSQLRELAFSLQPGLHGSRPINTVLRGLPGTGKTTSIKRIFTEVEETTKRLVPVYVNCQNDRTLFAVYSKIFFQLYGHFPPSLGMPVRKVLNQIGHALIERKIVLVVCLDDANYLLPDKVLNSVIYTLLRLHEEFPGTRAGVIASISNMDIDFSRELDSCVVSVFQPTEIYFPPYTSDETRNILLDRARQALYPGVLSDEMMDIVVEKAMSCGDLRVGIDLVRRSVLHAEKLARIAVDEEDISMAFEESKYVHLAATIRTLACDERRLLGHIAELTIEDPKTSLTSGLVYSSAREKIRIGYTAFHERLKKFDEMRLINVNHRNQGGRTREIVLRYDPERVVVLCG